MNRMSIQRLNTELLVRGSRTSGSYERKLERLQRFLELEKEELTNRERLNLVMAEEQIKARELAKLRAAEYEAIWVLMNLKTETHESVHVPTIHG
jgi:hypothetical protein